MPIKIPKVQTDNRHVNQLQQNISTALAPVLNNDQAQGQLISNVSLTTGSNTINTGLNKTLTGWHLARKDGPADVYDNQQNNPNPKQTLILIASAPVNVDIYVF